MFVCVILTNFGTLHNYLCNLVGARILQELLVGCTCSATGNELRDDVHPARLCFFLGSFQEDERSPVEDPNIHGYWSKFPTIRGPIFGFPL